MHLLMISLDSSLLGDPHGNTVTRHVEYAERIGQISVIVYNAASDPKTVTRLSDRLIVYPTNVRTPYLFPWAAYRLGVRIHRLQRADLITTQDPFATGLIGLWLKWRLRLPLNAQSHSHFFENPDWVAERPLRNRVLQAIGNFVVKRADSLRVLSEREKAICVRRGLDPRRITVLAAPTNVGSFAPPVPPERLGALRAALGIAPDAPVLLWVGFPSPAKNVDLLLEAFARVRQRYPAARLVMAGDFSQRPNFRQRAEAQSVIFPGLVSYTDLPAYYQLAEVYVHSSRYEGIARVLMEALAAGTPVASTAHLGADEVVRPGETGLLTDHTPDALAGAVIALLDDPARARAMGEAGQRDVLERFDYERQLDRVVQTYRDTLHLAGRG
ncbi:MAG: glycosyltransferase family 4 protein [Chloroflexota bacterium]